MKLGVVADDVTGAADLADAVCDEGWSATVVLGVPAGAPPAGDCTVVALKSRTAPVGEAVAESAAAARWLLDAGAELIYQKYCSTFDSTDRGNIGPVADALRALLGDGPSVGTPATPRAGRTVYQGHLFVGRELLAESPMRDHPLTPMRDSDLVRVLGRQAAAPVTLVDRGTVARGPDAVRAAIDGVTGQVLVDALDDADLDVTARAVHALRGAGRSLLTGGAAGLAAALARTAHPGGRGRSSFVPPPAGDAPRLIVSGSCSLRTREQVAAFPGPLVPLRAAELEADLAGGVARAVDVAAAAFAAGVPAVLVSSTAPPEELAGAPPGAAELLERAAGEIARTVVAQCGVRRVLVAGGETSGAVVRALGVRALRVGPSAGAGLPWMVPAGDDSLALLLKSGNFGTVDLFRTAWEACP